MATAEAREIFNRAAAEAIAKGDADAAARIELAREYFTNPEFRSALAEHLWQTAA